MKPSDLMSQFIMLAANKIINLPFFQEMTNGTLDKNKFFYYMKQDSLYLRHYAECSDKVTEKIEPEYKPYFSKLSYNTKAYYKQVDKILIENGNFTNAKYITSATMGYIDHMELGCDKSVEVAQALLLTCNWIYREVGAYIYNNSVENNIYEPWITPYSDPDYIASVDEQIVIFDESLGNANNTTLIEVLATSKFSAYWEVIFPQNAYEIQQFNNL